MQLPAYAVSAEVQMKKLYNDILHSQVGYLPPRRRDTTSQYTVSVTTTLPMYLTINSVDSEGRWHFEVKVQGGSGAPLPANDGDAFVITDFVTNAFVGAFTVPTGGYTNNIL